MCAHVEGERCDVCMWEGGENVMCACGSEGETKEKEEEASVERGREGESTRLPERACMS